MRKSIFIRRMIPASFLCLFAGGISLPAGCVHSEVDTAQSYRGAVRFSKISYYRADRTREYREYESNSRGSIFRETVRLSDGKIREEVKKYSMEGNRLRISTLDGKGALRDYTIQEYDSSRLKLLKRLNYDSRDRLLSSNVYEYDRDGNLLSKKSYDAANRLHGHSFRFDSFGNVIRDDYYAGGKMQWYSTHEYDRKNNIKKHVHHNADGTVGSYRTFTYDSRGNRTESISYNASGTALSRITTVYNVKGQRIRVSFHEGPGSPEATLRLVKEYFYGPENRLSKVVVYDSSKKITGSMVYEYSKGSKTKNVYYDGKNELIGYNIYSYDIE